MPKLINQTESELKSCWSKWNLEICNNIQIRVHLNISASFPPKKKINVENAPSADSPWTLSIKDNFFSPADGREQDPVPLLEAFQAICHPARLQASNTTARNLAWIWKRCAMLPGIWPWFRSRQAAGAAERSLAWHSGCPVYDNECGIATFTPC